MFIVRIKINAHEFMSMLLENIRTEFERIKRMYIHVAENLQDELNNLREKTLDLNDNEVGFILSRLIRILGDVIAYSPKEDIEEED